MKAFQDLSLKQLVIALMAIILLLFMGEYFVVETKLDALEEIDQKIDFVRHAQIDNQHLEGQVQSYLEGKHELNAEIFSGLDLQDHALTVIAKGGRIDGTTAFIRPLSRLSSITFESLDENWTKYKDEVKIILTESQTKAIAEEAHQQPLQVKPDSLVLDSVQQVPDVLPAPVSDAQASVSVQPHAILSGRWLTVNSWYDKLILDLKEEESERKSTFNNWLVLIGVFDIALFVCLYFLFNESILKPLHVMGAQTAAKTHIDNFSGKEIGALAHSINDLLEQLKDATEFVGKIGEGNLKLDYRELDGKYVAGKNKLADSLVSMQLKLKTLNDEEQKRQWSNEGLAKFVDILRSSNDNIHELGDRIISALVQYTKSNQGALYILNDENEYEKHLELISLFAFEIKKYETKKIKLGEGILGQTFLERETTYLNEIPEDYIRITSGLGDATPKTILMVPLKVDTQVYGIVELASFKEYLPHEIAFVEKLGENIASTLASVKSAQRNRHLIEQFQEQTEVMRAQEEEMRQNMEELQATQEEIARKERDYITRIQQLEQETLSLQNADKKLVDLRAQMAIEEKENKIRISDLQAKIAKNQGSGKEWELAQEVEKSLKINLEALKITQQAIEHKAGKN